MWDGVLSCARENLLPLAREHLLPIALDHLLPILKEAANMIRGVPTDIAEMKKELENIEDFIHQADKMADAEGDNTSHGIRAKIKKLIEATFRIQDVIDEYIIREEQRLPDPGCAAGDNYVKTKILRLQIAHKIQHIKSRINEIKDTSSEKDHEGSSSSATNLNATSLQNLRKAPFYMDEADVVGFEEPKDILIDWLVEVRAARTVVSVVAMGGQGKTTLAKKVFDNNKVIKHFDCRVWITVSQSYDLEKLLRDILQKIYKQQEGDTPQSIHQMDRDSLVDEVRKNLQQKRYVVVFDDVWSILFWDEIDLAMIDNKNGSKILITTRNMNVANACKKSSFVEVHELKPLTKEKSLELFNKKAFYDLDGCCPENLTHISSEIVEKCIGLPLAIVIVGGLLSCKDKETFEWYNFSENINPELKEDSNIKNILGLSYHNLPYYLKSCLLYFGLYPEDCVVSSKTLTRQWMAEGFVKEDRGKTLEEVAEGYLTELIRRSLVQLVSISIDGRRRSCRVHDLVHAMILEKCEDLSFCKNICEDRQSSLTGIVRRLSIATNSDNLIESVEKPQVRSLLCYASKPLPESFVRRIPTKFRRLKVLVLGDDGLLDVPKDLGSLSYLKFFMFGGVFRGRKFSLPISIVMLENLETLDLTDTKFNVMPKEICKLRKLRHFIGIKMSLIQLKDGIGDMTSLQTLRDVYLDEKEDENDNRVVELIQELGKLKQLRELALLRVRAKYMSAISSSINNMRKMEKLRIEGAGENIVMHLSSPPPMLRNLKLNGDLKKTPEWISKLHNLAKLKVMLVYSKQTVEVMKLLKSMPNLLSLNISNGDYESKFETLHFQDGWFKNLKELYVGYFVNLSYILIDEGALGSLIKLQISSIRELKTLPIGIQHLNKLEFLHIFGMGDKFMQSIALDGGKDHWIFKQVPYVKISEGHYPASPAKKW